MGNPQYTNIDEGEEQQLLSQGRNARGFRFSSSILVGFAAVVLIVYGAKKSMETSATPASLMKEELPLEGSPRADAGDAVRHCTFTECYASACNGASAPYTCLFHNGGPHGGCSVHPWLEGTCEVQCDLTGCEDLDIPSGAKSCVGEPCSKEWCTNGQMCPTDVPFQCVDGSARFGCSDDGYHWTLRVSADTCAKCCDTTTC